MPLKTVVKRTDVSPVMSGTLAEVDHTGIIKMLSVLYLRGRAQKRRRNGIATLDASLVVILTNQWRWVQYVPASRILVAFNAITI